MRKSISNSDTFSIESASVTWHDGINVFTKRWIPKYPSTRRAIIIFLHGFAEHTERYDHVWPRFVAQGFEILGYDQRGFGRTGPKYGDTTLEQQVVDLDYAIRKERKRLDEKFDNQKVPIFLYGHSMGGGIILSLLTQPRGISETSTDVRSMISGVICGAPWILRTKPPPSILLRLVPWVAWVYPNMSFRKTLNPHHLTSDPEVAKKIVSDPFFRGDIFIKTVSGLLSDGYRILSEGYKNWPADLPILITHGEKDPSASPDASRTFVEKLTTNDKEFKSWPDMLHEGHNERPELRDPFLKYSLRWLENRTPMLKESL